MNRLRKIGAALAVAGMLATYVPSGLVLAQVNPNSPIEVSVDILLQVDANPPKRQENATYEILDEAGNVVYRHESDTQASEAPKLTAGKYRLRLYDGQGFKRADKVLKAQKVETSIPKRSEQDIAANKQLQEQSDKGSLKTDDQGQSYYEVTFEVKAGPDLESADHQKMVSKLAVTLSDQDGAGSAPQAPAQSASQAPAAKRNLTIKVLDQAQAIVPGATVTVEGQTAVTDENGDAHFKDLTPGTVHYAVTQLPAGYEGTPSGEAELPSDTDHSITLQVAKKAESQVTKRDLTIKVLDQEQKLVPGVTVTVEGQTAVTDENGDAHFKGLTPGMVRYAVTKLPDGYEGTPSGEAELPTDTDHSITLQVTRKDQASSSSSSSSQTEKRDLTVKVLDNAGKEVPGVSVKIGDQVQVTNEYGQAVFKGLTPGTFHYEIVNLPENYTGAQAGDAELPADTDHSITLTVQRQQAVANVTVKVMDDNNQSVPGVTVYLGELEGQTDDQGNIHFEALEAGKYTYGIKEVPEAYQAETGAQTLDVAPGADLHPILKVSRKAQVASLELNVVNVAGQAVADVTLAVGNQQLKTDAQGKVTFTDLKAGDYDYYVVAVPEPYQLDQTKIKLTLANGQTAKRTIQLAEKPAASSSSSASSDKVTATKTSNVERKDGKLPSTGEQVMAWLTPLALALIALAGAILFFRRRKNQASTDASQDEDHEA